MPAQQRRDDDIAIHTIRDDSIVRRILGQTSLCSTSFAFAASAALALCLAFLAPAPARAAQTSSPHGKFKEECALCHSAKVWSKVQLSPRFDHAKYGMPLVGAHLTNDCKSCHKSLDFTSTRAQCVSCHEDPHRGENGGDCAHCHGSRSFTDRAPMVLAHQLTQFPLTEAHASVACESCHKPSAQGQMQYKGTSLACAGCHMDNYRSAKSPDHVTMGFPTDCKLCHKGMTDWKTAAFAPGQFQSTTFTHPATFPLTNAHAGRQCDDCHKGNYISLANNCYSCHQNMVKSYDNVTNPIHTAPSFGTTNAACLGCHNTTAWAPSTFVHPAAFPLTNAHAGRQCVACHGTAVYAGTSVTCISCHQNTTPGYASARNPVHDPTNFPVSTCTGCHNTVAWRPASLFTHPGAFPMKGSHSRTVRQCDDCHGVANGGYTSTSQECYSCHANSTPGYNHLPPGAPVHTPANFPTATSNCVGCHTQAAAGYVTWAGASGFDHTAAGFPLTNAHLGPACDDCHKGNYTTLVNNCYSCHQTRSQGYGTATNPPHSTPAFGTDNASCTGCHTTVAFSPTKYKHVTTFPLTNGHSAQLCETCHAGNYVSVMNNCYTCHQSLQKSYASATNPPHTTPAFGTTNAACTACHNTVAFSPSTFAHPTTFPLTNAHAGRLCQDCHAGNYTTLANNCYTCHQPAYAAATSAKHTPVNFPTTNAACTGCHNTVAFSPATWPQNHSTTAFAANFKGAHVTVACSGCHNAATWNVLGTANNCYGCHAADYASAVPAHDPVSYPQAGCTCHNLTAWTGATVFDHTTIAGFSVAGAHNLGVRQCNDCHSIIGNTAKATDVDCITCHANSSPGYNNVGAGNPAHNATYFPSTTAQCRSCHTAASTSYVTWAGGTYTHTTMQLTNAHAGRLCNDCHAGNYTTVAYNCYGCHQAAYAAATSAKHTPTNFPTTNAACMGCHNTVAFSPATWPQNHSTTAFAANFKGAHVTVACSGCHNAATWNVLGTANNCYGCHAADYAGATPTHDPTNYPQAGCTCHNLTAWTGATVFDHTTIAGFSVAGAHNINVRQCNDCHSIIGNTAKATDVDCITCHANSSPGYNNVGAGNPAHNATYFPSTTAQCRSCHTAASTSYVTWAGGTYTHTTMQLTNAHAGRLCNDCHAGNYTTVAYNCYGCHQAAYAAATSAKHTPTNFPTTNAACMGCHNTVAFSPATWPQNHSTTAFASYYTGAHPAVACTGCHNIGTWNVLGTGNNCYGCHAADYASATPTHTPAGYPQAGCTCHTTTTWTGANAFDHTAGGFPLTGNHSTTVRQCTDCHSAANGGYVNTSMVCYSCHASSTPGYVNTGAGVPAHTPTYFPTANCTTCHAAANTSHVTWANGTFANHTWFPIASGRHAGIACMDCHNVDANLASYSCAKSCHTSALNGHPKTNGFSLTTVETQCYVCHKSGNAG